MMILLNARIQVEFEQLEQIVSNTIEDIRTQTGCAIVVDKMAAFQPAYPKPSYRF